jgi:NTP pyrophosphatase (non-canonical NTP hydrolase)
LRESKNINEQTRIYKGKRMTNVFRDQEKFMRACDQTVENLNQNQFKMYLKLIKEEYNELLEAQGLNQNLDRIEYLPVDEIETLDALIDILVVTIGAIHSMGSDAEGAWKEVMSTNFAKIDKETGKVRKREDGKVLKPVGWVAPNLESFIKKETK